MLEYLRAEEVPWDEQTCAHAALGGHLSVLQWARARGCPWNMYTCEYSAWEGNLHILAILSYTLAIFE